MSSIGCFSIKAFQVGIRLRSMLGMMPLAPSVNARYLSAADKHMLGMLNQFLARPQHGAGEAGMVGTVRPALGFEAEPGMGTIGFAIQTRNRGLDLEAGVELQARLERNSMATPDHIDRASAMVRTGSRSSEMQ